MVESCRALPSLTSELPPKYSRRPPTAVSRSFSFSREPLRAFRRALPRSHDDPPPFAAINESSSTPPVYTAFDESTKSFQLSIPLINTRSVDGATKPRYQISHELTKSGKPLRLYLRRLLPSESRSLSIQNTWSPTVPVVAYDDDTTLYTIEDVGALSPFKGQSVEIRGRRARTLPGIVKFRAGFGTCDFWHLTRIPAKDSMRQQNEKKMQRYGYRAADEWKRKKLFSSRPRLGKSGNRCDWTNGEGKTVATEDGNELVFVGDMDQAIKDVLVTCFVARRWASGRLNWTCARTADSKSLGLVTAIAENDL